MPAYALVRERVLNGKVSREQAGTIVKTLSRVNGLKSDRKKFRALEKIHDKLNAIEVTRLSVESVYRKVGCLVIQKRVPIFAKKKTAKAIGLTDVAGLTEKMEQANKLKRSGRGQQAYAMLLKVAGTLKQFKD